MVSLEEDVHKEVKPKEEVKSKGSEKKSGSGTEGSSARKRKKDKKQVRTSHIGLGHSGRCVLGGANNHIKAFNSTHSKIKGNCLLEALTFNMHEVCWGEHY